MSPKIDSRILSLTYESLIPQVHWLPNAADWQSTCRALVARHLRCRQGLRRVAQDLRLDLATAESLVKKAKASIEEPQNGPRGAYVQSLICDERDCPRANAIGRAMYDLFRKSLLARYFVRDAVLQYAARARQPAAELDSNIPEDLEYAKLLARLVGDLGMADLAVRFMLTGNREIGSEDVKKLKDDLELPGNLSWVICRPSSGRRSPAGTLIGIEVVQTISQREAAVDTAFRSVILLAEVFEPWNFSSSRQDNVVESRGHCRVAVR
jgi:hypothetical protein